METPAPQHDLVAILRKFGVPALSEDLSDARVGFPVQVPLKRGGSLLLDLPEPALIGTLDPGEIGMAILDASGFTRRSWGLAKRLPFFRAAESCLLTDIAPLIGSALEGSTGSLYLDGVRYFVGPYRVSDLDGVLVLVIDAGEEKRVRHAAGKSGRSAHVLKRVGKALTMDQRMQQLCVSAVHEIASASELAAVLLWTVDPQSHAMVLSASTGANRQGTAVLAELESDGGTSCVAELVASSHQALILPNVHDHVMTSELEAKFCYLRPGGLSVHPLVISDKLLGVLELVGREGDAGFAETQELFQTIAEHLALALNSAMLFENFERMASHDALTGIANHRTMQDFLHKRLAESTRHGHEIGVLMIDVDHFRSFNEEEGHDAGDQVLRLVADALKASVRPYDLAARYGGEEFTIVMPGSGRAATVALAERIRKRVEQIAISTRSGRDRSVTVSIGCAVYPETAEEAGGLLKAADTALYEAKREGRNRAVFFEGRFLGELRTEDIDPAKLWRWVPKAERRSTEKLLAQLEPWIQQFSVTLRLSNSQQQILSALAIVHRTYRSYASRPDSAKWREMEAAEEFRPLLPSLRALDERFDGAGPNELPGDRIPLLARVLTVLLALVEERGRVLVDDPGRFDPAILAAISEVPDAA